MQQWVGREKCTQASLSYVLRKQEEQKAESWGHSQPRVASKGWHQVFTRILVCPQAHIQLRGSALLLQAVKTHLGKAQSPTRKERLPKWVSRERSGGEEMRPQYQGSLGGRRAREPWRALWSRRF